MGCLQRVVEYDCAVVICHDALLPLTWVVGL